MSASEAPQDFIERPKPRNLTAILLVCAGGAVIAGACMTAFIWREATHAALCMMSIAIILSVGAIARSAREQGWADPVRDVDGSSMRTLWFYLSCLLLMHVALALFVCTRIPAGNVDTFTFQNDACKSLLHGSNPFGSSHDLIYDPQNAALFYGPGVVVNGRVNVGFQYPPLTLLWILPGYILGDVRYSYILAVMLSAMLLFAICPNKRGLQIAAILLLSPLTFGVEDRSWTEPMVLMALTATVFAALRNRWWLPIALGLFLATKQYNFLALPLAGFLIRPFEWKAYWKLIGKSVAVGVATVVPFACWNFMALWHDLVLFHLAQPFRQDAVSFAVLFPLMLKVGPIILIAFIAWSMRTAAWTPAMFAACYGVSLLLFVSTSKQAFDNYFFLVAQALFLGVAALPALASHTAAQAIPKMNESSAATL